MAPRDLQQTGPVVREGVAFPAGGTTLSGTLFRPQDTPRAAVVLNGATGVAQSYYFAFAEWLAGAEQVAVLVYDYSDYGASAVGHLKDATATMAQWGVRDQMAARGWLRAEFPALPLWIIGHSLGAMLLHHQEGLEDADRIIAVASGPAFWREHAVPFRYLAWVFWYAYPPLAAWLLGYMPGSKLGMGADLPAGVYWQWRRWCTSRDFNAADIGTALPVPPKRELKTRVKFVAIEDDQTVTPASAWKLMRHYPTAPKRQLLLKPREFGLGKVGHIGVFAARNSVMWPEIVRDFTPPRPAICG